MVVNVVVFTFAVIGAMDVAAIAIAALPNWE
jgi:hypothetical protein